MHNLCIAGATYVVFDRQVELHIITRIEEIIAEAGKLRRRAVQESKITVVFTPDDRLADLRITPKNDTKHFFIRQLVVLSNH